MKKSELSKLRDDIDRLSKKVENGLTSKVASMDGQVKWLTGTQRWQIGLMVLLIGLVVGGLAFLWQEGEKRTEKMLDRLDQHIEQSFERNRTP